MAAKARRRLSLVLLLFLIFLPAIIVYADEHTQDNEASVGNAVVLDTGNVPVAGEDVSNWVTLHLLPSVDWIHASPYWIVSQYFWVNASVTAANATWIDYVTLEIINPSTAQSFLLKWTQATGLFTEESDVDGICSLNATDSERSSIDYYSDLICYNFAFSNETIGGDWDVNGTIVDDGGGWGSLYVEDLIRFVLVDNVDVEITDMEGCGNWLFAQEKYYTFQAVYEHAIDVELIDFGKIRFSDGFHDITVAYGYQDNKLYLEEGGDYAYAHYISHSETATQLTVNIGIFLQDTIVDASNVDIYLWCNSTAGDHTDWELIAEDYFNIYCIGGYVETLSSGTSGRLDGGDTFELWVGGQTDSWIAANQTWRKLQHYHTSFALQGLFNDTGVLTEEDQIFQDEAHASPGGDHFTEKGAWKLYTSIYYCVNDTWVKGWTLELQMEEGDRSGGLLTEGDFWCKINATWYQKETKIKSSVFNSYIEIEPTARIRFWLDLWFNEANASPVAGGRINAYYYGMINEGFLLWSNFRPMQDYALDSFYFNPILDENDNIISSTQLKMMKVGFNLTKPTSGTPNFVLKMRDFEESEAQRVYLGPNPMRGISTPVVQEPKIPDMSSFGFFSPIINALRSLATRLVNALIYTGMEVWKYMVGFFDTIFSSLGWHNGFSTMTGWLAQFFAWIPSAVSWMIQIFTQIFRVITVGLPLFVQGLVMAIGYGLSIFTVLGNLYSAVAEFFGGIWSTYLASFWDIGLQLAPFAVALYICHLIYLVTSGQVDDAEHEVRLIYNFTKLVVHVTMFFVDVFYKIAQLTLQIVMGLIGVL